MLDVELEDTSNVSLLLLLYITYIRKQDISSNTLDINKQFTIIPLDKTLMTNDKYVTNNGDIAALNNCRSDNPELRDCYNIIKNIVHL